MFVEFWTSPNPAPQNSILPEWSYDLKSGELQKLNGGKIPYLHFLFFKKTHWLDTEYYWRDGFYALDSDFEKYKTISFNYHKIQGNYGAK